RYSSLADQFGVNFFSSPAPSVQPTRVWASENEVDTLVGAVSGAVRVAVSVVEYFTSPTARPPVPYNSRLGSARRPTRPLNVANHGSLHSLAADSVMTRLSPRSIDARVSLRRPRSSVHWPSASSPTTHLGSTCQL